MLNLKLLKHLNIGLIVLPILIFSLGYLTLLSTSPEIAKSQIVFFMIGSVLYIGMALFDYEIFKYYWKPLYIFSLALLVLTFLLGETRFGSSRWLNLGFFSFQPSEFVKISLVLVISSLIVAKNKSLTGIKSLLSIGAVSLSFVILIFIQPDLGTAIVLMASIAIVLFYGGLNKWFYIGGFLLFGIFSAPLWELLKDYQKRRILVFINPSLDVLGSGYNVIQALIAVGSGGLFGKGFGHGTQSQLNFLPAHWTDFAFASFAEEWGFVGVVLLLSFFVLLLATLIRLVYKTNNIYGKLVLSGVLAVFFAQFFINVGMNLGIMPVTGIPLPFVSAGGSSLVVSMILLGIAQSVWIRNNGLKKT